MSLEFESSPEYSKDSQFGYMKQKHNGAFYTPFWLAYRLAATTFSKMRQEQIKNIKIIDPACGEGVFLVACAHLLLNIYKVEPLTAAKQLFGADIEASETSKSRENLLCYFSKCVSESKLRQIKSIILSNITTCDSLNHFRQNKYKGAFGLIIGNPPWRIQRNRRDFDHHTGESSFKRKNDGDLLSSKTSWNHSPDISFNKSSSDADIYLSFLELALHLRCKNGHSSFILPDSFLTNSNALSIRERLLKSDSIFIEGFINSKKAFDADVRKKFETVICSESRQPKLEVAFGGIAGRTLEESKPNKSFVVDLHTIETFSLRKIIPDIRSRGEMRIINCCLRSGKRLKDFLDDNVRSISKLLPNKFIRGADIQIFKTDIEIMMGTKIIWRKITKDDNTRTLLVNLIGSNVPYDKNSAHKIGVHDPKLLFAIFAFMNSTICDFLLKTQITVNATRESVLDIPCPDLANPKFRVLGAVYAIGYFGISTKAAKEYFDDLTITKANRLLRKFQNRQIETFQFVEEQFCSLMNISTNDYVSLQEMRFRSFNKQLTTTATIAAA